MNYNNEILQTKFVPNKIIVSKSIFFKINIWSVKEIILEILFGHHKSFWLSSTGGPLNFERGSTN